MERLLSVTKLRDHANFVTRADPAVDVNRSTLTADFEWSVLEEPEKADIAAER